MALVLVHTVLDQGGQVDHQVGIQAVIKVDLVVILTQVGMGPTWALRVVLQHKGDLLAVLQDLRDMDHLALRAMVPLGQNLVILLIVTMDPPLMGQICHHQAAQAQAWVPHLPHPQDTLLVILQVQELPQLVVDIQPVLAVTISLPPPLQTSRLVPLIVRVIIAPLHHWSLQDQMDNLCMTRPVNSQLCLNHQTTQEVDRHPREDISRATHMGLVHLTAVLRHLVAV